MPYNPAIRIKAQRHELPTKTWITIIHMGNYLDIYVMPLVFLLHESYHWTIWAKEGEINSSRIGGLTATKPTPPGIKPYTAKQEIVYTA